MSGRCKDSNAHVIQEALRRARYEFPGRQKIIISKKWSFTNVDREAYLKLEEDKRVLSKLISFALQGVNTEHIRDGAYVQFIPPNGPPEANLRAWPYPGLVATIFLPMPLDASESH